MIFEKKLRFFMKKKNSFIYNSIFFQFYSQIRDSFFTKILVHVCGTATILNLAQKHNVNRFIYTSSYNVIFSKKELINITEEEPYPDDKDQYDWYSKTKKEAEKMILAANNEDFRTCALRPNGIYGRGSKIKKKIILERDF